MAPYFTDRGNVTKADLGRFNVTGDQRDMYMFKVPSLRNVELTAPYFHDGSAATLADAVRMMAKYQLGRHLTGQEVELIVEFLKTLTGELDGKPL
jgi:cytochrome c peroxidase